MKTIYLDSDFKCHITDDGTMIAIKTDFFDGKCDTFVEGYRYIPEGATWARNDQATFNGLMIAPWESYDKLFTAQKEYESIQEDFITSYTEGVNSI